MVKHIICILIILFKTSNGNCQNDSLIRIINNTIDSERRGSQLYHIKFKDNDFKYFFFYQKSTNDLKGVSQVRIGQIPNQSTTSAFYYNHGKLIKVTEYFLLQKGRGIGEYYFSNGALVDKREKKVTLNPQELLHRANDFLRVSDSLRINHNIDDRKR